MVKLIIVELNSNHQLFNSIFNKTAVDYNLFRFTTQIPHPLQHQRQIDGQ